MPEITRIIPVLPLGPGAVCKNCSGPYTRKKSWQEFCCTKCNTAWHDEQKAKLIAELRVKASLWDALQVSKPKKKGVKA